MRSMLAPVCTAASEKDRATEIVNMLIHTADLSAQVLPLPVARVWEDRISREFSAQAVQEAKLGIPGALRRFFRALA